MSSLSISSLGGVAGTSRTVLEWESDRSWRGRLGGEFPDIAFPATVIDFHPVSEAVIPRHSRPYCFSCDVLARLRDGDENGH